MQCKNCNNVNEGKFCSNCGQKLEIHRLKVSHILHDLFHYFSHADHGILNTTKELLADPGHVIEEYINGKRKKYFNPFTFLLLSTTLSTFVYYKFQYYSGMQVYDKSNPNIDIETMQLMQYTAMLMEKYGKQSTILLIPVISAISYLFYFRRKLNYAEHLTLFSYVFGIIGILNIILILISYLFFPKSFFLFNMIFQFIFLIYLTLSFSKIFTEHFFISLLKSFAIIILFIISYWLISLGLVSIYLNFIK